ncbi:AAA family ATPase [Pseudomonas mandelii]|uniref:AAA family ATPase n=1 Tax=Pseudomonas mandelii TaxID=75612 RepID=UPI0012B4124C|nr:AAA family ATPase [Pseudomonas mandelii]MSU93960.1 AAA family ATPase [Pseudomonas mandelii]
MSVINNASSLNDKLHAHLSAGYPGFYIQSSEEARVDRILTLAGINLQLHLMEWNLAYGWVDFRTKQPRTEATQTELAYCLPALADEDLSRKLIVIKDAKAALENQPLAIARLKQLLNRIQRHHRGECAVVLVAESLFIAPQIEAQITLLPLPLPGREEIIEQIKSFADEQNLIIPQALLPRLAATCSGLSEEEIRQVLAMVQQPHPELNEAALGLIHYEKEQIIAKSGVLEMVKVGETASDIGGLENLKQWLKRRAEIFRRLDEAEGAGVTAPKGVLIAGMPGCGKSLTAKAAAHLFQLPLLRLDIGSLLGKYVGESEHNMRRALTMAESVSPCILWIDELEKAFVGMGSGEGSEVSSRLFGYFLTWMQEKTGAVFVIATANNISALPAELLRKGRFDEVFYVGFPNAKERSAILGIHLRQDWGQLTEQQQQTLTALCRDYSGADIQNAVGEARESAFLDGQLLTHEDIERAIRATVPLRETLREQVGKYEVLFEKLKLKPASRIDGLNIAQMIQLADSPNPVRRKEVARHLECPDDLLEKLSADTDLEVRLSVYRNPNCTERLLASCLSKDKKAPDFDMSTYRLSCLHPRAPMDLLASELDKWDGSDYIQEEALLACSHLTDEVKLALFCKTKNHQTRIGICQQVTLSVELQGQLIETLWDTRLSQTCVQFILLIANPVLDPTYHKKIASHKTDQIIDALLCLENLSNEAQMVILADSCHFLKLAKNPNINQHVQLSLLLQALPESDAESVLDALKPGSTSVFFYNIIYSHPFQDSHFEEVYLELSQNPNLSADAVRVLVAFERNDENSSIMLNLASNPGLPKHWQLEFANSNNHWLKSRLAANPKLQDAARARLQEQGIESADSSSDTSGTTKDAEKSESTVGAATSTLTGSIFSGAIKFQGGFLPSWFNGDKS